MSGMVVKLIWSMTYDPAIEGLVDESEKDSHRLPYGNFTTEEADRIRRAFEEYRWACDLLNKREAR